MHCIITVMNPRSHIERMFQDGLTALMAASQEGRTDVVDLLIKHNADVNARKRVIAIYMYYNYASMTC